MLHPSHLEETVVLRELFDVWVVVRARVAHEVKGPSAVRLLDGFGEDHTGGVAGGHPSEGDAKGAHDERLVELLKVGIARLCRDGDKRFYAFWKMALMSASLDMLKGGEERAAHGPFNVT